MKTKRQPVKASRPRKKIDRARPAAVVSTILVPVDFSIPSSKALHYACTLAKAFGARLQLLHVNEAVVEAPALASAFPVAQAKQLRRLADFAADLSLPSRGLRYHIRNGRAFNEICEAARELSADLIICGTHGYRGMARLFLGSTAERIVQHSTSPVLIVREHQREFVAPRRRQTTRKRRSVRLNRIVVGTDFSETSRDALVHAVAFARRFGADLLLVNAIYPQYYATNADYLPFDYGSLLDETRRAAEKDMDEIGKSVPFGDVSVQTRIEEGHPGESLVKVAEEERADLIVVSTHGRTGLPHVLIGSTAQHVVRHANCPVLVIPRAAKTKETS